MHLWTEYEGRTIAEHYTLGKLLRSEGRNGFFATADKDGHPAVIRLTEAHYDEAEQLRRWRQVAEVHQDNLIEIEQVGQTTFEGVALTYALMEPDDANLGDVLKERPMTTAETMQVAKAVLAALKALHEKGLVHEHVEPANVLAVGETVKLRSDCVRECIADGEFTTSEECADLRRRDLHDFGTLLLRLPDAGNGVGTGTQQSARPIQARNSQGARWHLEPRSTRGCAGSDPLRSQAGRTPCTVFSAARRSSAPCDAGFCPGEWRSARRTRGPASRRADRGEAAFGSAGRSPGLRGQWRWRSWCNAVTRRVQTCGGARAHAYARRFRGR